MSPSCRSGRLPPVLAALLLAGAFQVQGHAQTLAQALEQAWSRHPQAAALAARQAEARARTAAATALTPGPAAVSLSQVNDRVGSRRGRQEWELEWATPLWLPGQQAAHRAEAEAAAALLEAQAGRVRLELAGELREAWWALVAARQADVLAGRRLSSARALGDEVQRRYRAGDVSRVDANLAQAEELSAQAAQIEAEAAVAQAEQAWMGLTGSPAAGPVDAESAPADAPGADHPRLAAAQAGLQLARARLQQARRDTREAPELALRAGRERGDRGEPYASSIGVQLTLPLSFGPRVQQAHAGAQAEVDQAETELARLRERLQIERARARIELQAAQRAHEAASRQLALAADNLRLIEKSYALGESELALLLRTRAAAHDAEAQLDRQSTQVALARSRLRQAAGELP